METAIDIETHAPSITRVPEIGGWKLTSSVTLPHSRERIFEFFSDAFNLQEITPPWVHFRILTPGPIQIEQGTLIDYRLHLQGIPVRWRTEICAWDAPLSFCDRQLRGPYRMWEHTHRFETVPEGTLMTDEVLYRVPGGALIHTLFVRRKLVQIFAYRRAKMLSLFGASAVEKATA